jgi:filamin
VFTIHAMNPAGEALTHGGDVFTVEIEDADGNELDEEPEVKDNEDGTYGVTYKVPRPGTYTVSVDLHKPEARALSDPIKDSPFTVEVAAGFDPEKSEVYGPGVDKTVEDVEPADFHVKAVDQNGEPIKEGGLPLEVSVTDPDGETVPAELKDNGDGTYDVAYKPEKRGPHKVAVNCRGVPVGKSPFDVEVVAGADPDNSGIGMFKLSVTARNRRGEPMDHGGDKMEVSLKKRDGDEPWEGQANVVDNGDGTYSAEYEVPGSGDYDVTVRMNGRKIKGCPFKQVIP